MAGKKYTEAEINKIIELSEAGTPMDEIRETCKTQFGTVRPDSAFKIIFARSKRLVASK